MIVLRTALALAICFHVGVHFAHAQDRIWIQPRAQQTNWYPQPIQAFDGKIVRFDSQELECRPAGRDENLVFPAPSVIWIEPLKRSKVQAQGFEEFQTGQFAQALRRLPEILRERPAIWYQQWYTMMAAVAASRAGQPKISLELIAQLDRRRLPPWVVAWLPIQWRNQNQTPGNSGPAIERLDDPAPLVRLVAASWLLSSRTAGSGSRAKSVLAQLVKNERSEISRLAEALSWRLATPPQVKQSATQWQEKVDQLPMVWQTGPTLTLIEKFRSSGLSERSQRLQLSVELTPIHPHPYLRTPAR